MPKLLYGQHVHVKIGEKSFVFDEKTSGSSSDYSYSASSSADPFLVMSLDIDRCPPSETGFIQADVHYIRDVHYTSDDNYVPTNAKFLGSMRWKRIEDEGSSEQEEETDEEETGKKKKEEGQWQIPKGK